MKIIITSADGLVAATAAANEGVIFVQRIIDRFHGKMTVLIMCAVLLAGLLAGCGARAGSSGELDASGAGGNNAAAGQGGASNGQEGVGGAAAGEGGAKSGVGAASYPLTIKHAKGETVIREKPKSVAITYFPYADHLLAIGEMPEKLGVVGLSSLKNFPVYDPFTKDGRIIDLGNTANLEKVLEMSPDVIIAWEDDDKIYEQLAKIADTIVIPSSENWQDTITQVAAVMGREDAAQVYIDRYNAKLQEVAAAMEKSGEKGKTALFMMTWGKGFSYYGGKRMEPYYKDMGFKPFDSLGDWGEISLEGVSELNPDYIFVGEDFTNSAEMTLKELEANPVWNSLNAVKNKKLFVVDTEIVGPLAMGQSKGLELIGEIMGEGK